jgi:hypothetical protein
MKSTIKNTILASLVVAGLSFTSCKGKTEEADDTNTEMTSDSTEGMSSEPIGDTVVRNDGDTIVKTGTENDTKENATGTQVP